MEREGAEEGGSRRGRGKEWEGVLKEWGGRIKRTIEEEIEWKEGEEGRRRDERGRGGKMRGGREGGDGVSSFVCSYFNGVTFITDG